MATIAVPLGGQQARQEVDAVRRPALSEYLRWSVDHKIIGVQYGVTSLLFFIIGGTLAMGIRLELWTPELDLMVSGAAYNSLFTMHGTIMIFLFIIPMWAAYGNFVVPLQLGAKDMAFPWLNAFAFWLIPPAGIVMLLGYFVSPAEAGWTSYPPLSTLFSGDGQTLWALGAHLLGLVVYFWFDQLYRHDSQHAPTGDDHLAYAAALLGSAGDEHHRRDGDALPGRRLDIAASRSHDRHHLF